MARCLYHPDDCESERTVIISELKGGENDPDQFLDQEVTATAFRAHPYRHPTIGWLEDLEAMSREDLLAHYHRYYQPNNATLVIVGDLEGDSALRQVEKHFGAIRSGPEVVRRSTREPDQTGERRVTIQREGTAAYLKVAYHAPAIRDAGFTPSLLLDAVLTGAKGVNLWSSFRIPPPQRRARLYRALVETGAASTVQGALLPTEAPFLYSISATATSGTSLASVEAALLEELDRVWHEGVTPAELERAKAQLHARLVFDGDSVTNIAHQIGFFETIAGLDVFDGLPSAIRAVTPEQVTETARTMLTTSNRTVGHFDPLPIPEARVAVPG